ncbi:hypothetical protein [Metabacillus sp. SLBN-84]
MRQKALISGIAISTVGVGVTSYLLKDKANREKVTEFVQSTKNKIPYFSRKNTDSFPVEKAGHPDPEDIDDNTMVSEGSMYPVQYYDENQK